MTLVPPLQTNLRHVLLLVPSLATRDHKGYCCLDISTNKVITSHHIIFDELVFPLAHQQFTSWRQQDSPSAPNPSGSSWDLMPIRCVPLAVDMTRSLVQTPMCAMTSAPRGSQVVARSPPRESPQPIIHEISPIIMAYVTPYVTTFIITIISTLVMHPIHCLIKS
jgi:hypothetical protein